MLTLTSQWRSRLCADGRRARNRDDEFMICAAPFPLAAAGELKAGLSQTTQTPLFGTDCLSRTRTQPGLGGNVVFWQHEPIEAKFDFAPVNIDDGYQAVADTQHFADGKIDFMAQIRRM